MRIRYVNEILSPIAALPLYMIKRRRGTTANIADGMSGIVQEEIAKSKKFPKQILGLTLSEYSSPTRFLFSQTFRDRFIVRLLLLRCLALLPLDSLDYLNEISSRDFIFYTVSSDYVEQRSEQAVAIE